MKETFKKVVINFFLITVAVLVCTAISYNTEGNSTFPWYYPWLVIATGLTTALPSFLFYFKQEPTRKQFLLRTAIHFCIIEAIVLTEGAFFGWYSSLAFAIEIFVMVLIIYIFVFLCTYLIDKGTAKDINDALQKLNEEEN